MEDVELVIKVPEKLYKHIMSMQLYIPGRRSGKTSLAIILAVIKNGTPLPKGHGDLKDELDLDLFAPGLGIHEYVNDLMAKHNIDYVNGDDEDKVRTFATDLIHSCMNVIKTAPTIIEADREAEE